MLVIYGENNLLQTREIALNRWLSEQFNNSHIALKPLTGDAGFRRYFRFEHKKNSYIAVDAPSTYCNNQAFIDIQANIKQAGILVPELKYVDNQNGFFCLSDLGDTLLADKLSLSSMKYCYQQAMALIPQLASLNVANLAVFDDDFVQMELNIFVEWLLGEHLAITLNEQELHQLQQCFDVLKQNISAQPKVFMHRDFHSRNLMWLEQGIAVIDFQDAVHGPVTYDIVSLLRDCYVKWPNEQVVELFDYFVSTYGAYLIDEQIDRATWWRWFELTGLQRHVKAAGIFARLKHRDGKDGYLKDIPLTLAYIIDVSSHYPELVYLHHLVKTTVVPALEARSNKQ